MTNDRLFKKANKEAYWFMVGLYTAIGFNRHTLGFCGSAALLLLSGTDSVVRLTLRVASRLS